MCFVSYLDCLASVGRDFAGNNESVGVADLFAGDDQWSAAKVLAGVAVFVDRVEYALSHDFVFGMEPVGVAVSTSAPD
jgi:hypothetical protein